MLARVAVSLQHSPLRAAHSQLVILGHPIHALVPGGSEGGGILGKEAGSHASAGSLFLAFQRLQLGLGHMSWRATFL